MVVINGTNVKVRRDGSQRIFRVETQVIAVEAPLASIVELDALLAELICERDAWAAETAGDPYTILEISRTATDKEIRDAYRKQARAAHPDKKGGSDEQMQAVNAAYAAALLAAHHP